MPGRGCIRGMGYHLLLAFLGGVLLNFMPCVLPILALKAMSLRENSISYATGILWVFLCLATANVVLGWAWGEQFNSQPFVIGLTLLVFAMGLSYLGFWEIPQLGFRDRQSAFLKGVLTTVVATPCSGPLLGPVFGATLGQPAITVYAVFMAMGLGMSTPYMLVTACPSIRLPRPGNWMYSFKQACGLSLIAASIWLFLAVEQQYAWKVLAMAWGIGAVCWLNAHWPNRLRSLGLLAAFTTLIALVPSSQLNWEPYSQGAFESYRSEGRIVMVQFTAKWCATCQVNEYVLNSRAIREKVSSLRVVTLRAELDADSAELLRSLGFNSVPVLAIFGRETVVLPDLIYTQQVLDALETQ